MVIGCLGDIAFEVSSGVIKTFDRLTWTGVARYAVHARHGTNSLTEFCGIEPDGVSFEITLSKYLGADPMQELVKIWTYERMGEALVLTIGEKAMGKYRWNIVKHSIKAENYDGAGNIVSAVVSLELQEYLRG